jgi:hypothetical protein
MKKTIIGGFISLSSAIIVSAIIIAAGTYSPSLTSWSGTSRFWYAIFGAPTYGNGINLRMSLGFIFVLFSILLVAGVALMAYELFRKSD